jgi:O-antigen/teichoic acid export membrane protein
MLRGGQAFMASAAVTLLGSGLGSAFTVVNEAIAARILGPDGYGLYAVGMMLAKVSEVLAVFGLPLAVLRYVPLHLSRSEARLALATILGAVVVPLLLGLCFAACLWLCANAIARELFNAPGAAPFIAVLGLAVPGLALAELLGNVARAFGRPVVYVLVRNLIPPVGYSLMLFALLWTGRGGADVPCAYLTATGTGELLSSAGSCTVGSAKFYLSSDCGQFTPMLCRSVSTPSSRSPSPGPTSWYSACSPTRCRSACTVRACRPR